jgi:signal transduction histidine kinase
MIRQNIANHPKKKHEKQYLQTDHPVCEVCELPPSHLPGSSKSGSWIWHLKDNLLFWSPGLCQMVGITNQATSGFEQWLGLLSPEDLMAFSYVVREVLRDSQSRHLDLKVKTSQTEKTIRCYIESIIDPVSKDTLDMIGECYEMASDNFTEACEIRQKLQQQEEINRKLLLVLSHDLRTPLSAVLGFSEILLKRKPSLDSTKIEHYLETIHVCSRNAYSMITSLYDWAKSLQWNGTPNEFKLHTLVSEVLEELTFSAAIKNITFQNKIVDHLMICTDKEAIRIILRNLVSNAVKYSYPGGKVIVKARIKEKKFQLSVTDFGTGIHKETLKMLFQHDIGIPVKGTADESGLGIGLIICKELMKMLGGKIWAKSRAGKGTVFVIEG